jgi:hypothetical protein
MLFLQGRIDDFWNFLSQERIATGFSKPPVIICLRLAAAQGLKPPLFRRLTFDKPTPAAGCAVGAPDDMIGENAEIKTSIKINARDLLVRSNLLKNMASKLIC